MAPDQEAVKVIDNYLSKVIHKFSLEDSKESGERERKAQTLLGSLYAQGVSERVLKDQLVTVLIAGRVGLVQCSQETNIDTQPQDSIAIIVTWALYELARNPDILAELRKEISNTAELSDVLSPAQLESMKFLDSIVQETMRVHSSVGVNSRVALKDCTLPTGGGPHGTSPIGILAGTFLGKPTRPSLMLVVRKNV
jgi:cytochrome P450